MKHNIIDFGAVGDGLTDNTSAVQKALDCCRENGGKVVFPAGRFVVSSLYIHSNTILQFEYNSQLLGAQDSSVYKKAPGFSEEPFMDRALIISNGEKNITFCGNGFIDGRGDKEHFRPQGHTESGKSDIRPMLLCFYFCSNIKFADVTFKDPAGWGLVLKGCRDVYFSRITISHRSNINNDGIDLDGCRNVFIDNCNISSGDDAICLKSACGEVCSNIIVSNCVISSDTAGFKIGTSSSCDYNNITVSNCIFEDCLMGTIKILMVDGGQLDGVSISDCVIKNSEGPIFIRLGERMNKWGREQPLADTVKTCLKNVMLSNIQASIRSDCLPDRWGIMITGTPDYRVEDVYLNNIKIAFPGGEQQVSQRINEDVDRYPEQFFFGKLPSSGFYIRHAERIFLNNIFIRHESKDERSVLHTEDVENIAIQNFWFNSDKIF